MGKKPKQQAKPSIPTYREWTKQLAEEDREAKRKP
jgi:hypothetical protein